ncbi:MAG: phosphoribosylglycinamide formyltransferase [Bacillota bacterium]|nr:phosphoribosylglycinamide formyltransferase [Bacillota bacterium]
MLNIAVLVSGRGTNLQAIIDAVAVEGGELAGVARVVLVVSDRPKALALERARACGIPTAVVRKKDFPERTEHDRQVMAQLAAAGAELVCLAGYMRLLSPEFIQAYEGRMINVHPALLPAFPGLDVQRAALEYGVKVAGCTVHFVTLEMDSGPIIVQRAVAVAEDDTPETLAARILEQEHQAYVEAIALYAAGRLRIEGRRVRVLPG